MDANRAGEPFRMPLMRIPVTFWAISFALDVASLQWALAPVRLAFLFVATGVASAIIVLVATVMDGNRGPGQSPVGRVTWPHAFVLATMLVVFAVDSWLRAAWLDAPTTPFPAVALSALGLMLVAFTSFLNRQVAFDQRGSVVRLVRDPDERAPAGTIPFPPRRR